MKFRDKLHRFIDQPMATVRGSLRKRSQQLVGKSPASSRSTKKLVTNRNSKRSSGGASRSTHDEEAAQQAIGVQVELLPCTSTVRAKHIQRLTRVEFHLQDPLVSYHERATIVEPVKLPTFADPVFRPTGKTCDYFGGVYDGAGRFVEHTRMVRGKGAKAEHIVGPVKDLSHEPRSHIKGEVIYGGFAIGHPGHFLLEGLSRLWGAHLTSNKHPIYIQAPENRVSPFAQRIFELSGLSSSIRVIEQNTSFDAVLAPAPAFLFRRGAHRVYKDFFMRMTDRVLGPGRAQTTEQPLYFSRTALPGSKRGVFGEQILEEALRQNGVKIIYPEKLPLEEQIKLINEHRVVVGPIGTAFHMLLFSRIRQDAYVLANGPPPVSFPICDTLNGTNARYLLTASREPLFEHPRYRGPFYPELLDAQSALSQLYEAGVLSKRVHVTAAQQQEVKLSHRRQFLVKALQESIRWNDVSLATSAQKLIVEDFGQDLELQGQLRSCLDSFSTR